MERNIDKFWSISDDELLHKLEASRDGLTSIEAKEKLDIFGSNTIKKKKKMGDFILFVNQVKNPIIIILLVSVVLAFATSDSTDGLIITAIIVLSSIVGFWQERR